MNRGNEMACGGSSGAEAGDCREPVTNDGFKVDGGHGSEAT